MLQIESGSTGAFALYRQAGNTGQPIDTKQKKVTRVVSDDFFI